MFKEILDNIQLLNYQELNGKQLTMVYVEENGYGLLAGKDLQDGKIYILKEVKP
jgi:hypothetical protein